MEQHRPPDPDPMGFVERNFLGMIVMVPSRYEIIRPIGRGSFGYVIAVRDTVTDRYLAIKKYSNIFEQASCNKVRLHLLRELKLHKVLQSHQNILKIEGCYTYPTDPEHACDVYVISRLMHTTLARVIASDNVLTPAHCQYYIYQILRALSYLHSARIMHRDLTTQNILMNLNHDMRLSDFGFSRPIDDQLLGQYTDYIVTRAYRPPELLLMHQGYDERVDTWSAGCIFAELYLRQELFAGPDSVGCLERILFVLGSPEPDEYDFVTEPSAVNFLRGYIQFPKRALQEVVPPLADQPHALEFLGHMLAWDYRKRWTSAQLLQHPYLQNMRLENEPVADIPPWGPQMLQEPQDMEACCVAILQDVRNYPVFPGLESSSDQ